MAKATAAEAAITRQKIIDAMLSITLEKGFEYVTLGSLAKEVGISRSGVSGHFPKRDDLILAIQPEIAKMLREQLCFDSPELFLESWKGSLESSEEFRALVRAIGPIIPVDKGFEGMKRLINGDETEVLNSIYVALGYALVHLSKEH